MNIKEHYDKSKSELINNITSLLETYEKDTGIFINFIRIEPKEFCNYENDPEAFGYRIKKKIFSMTIVTSIESNDIQKIEGNLYKTKG